MKKQLRLTLIAIAALATIATTACDHYNCATGANFGSSTCTSTGTGIGTTGANPNSAYVFVADPAGGTSTGTIDSYTLVASTQTFGATASYTAPATPLSDNGVGLVVAQEQFLYTGYGSTNQIFGWQIGSDGTLTSLSASPYTATFMSSVPSGFGTQSIAVNPAGTLLFFSSAAGVYVYSIGSGGALTEVTGSPFAAPSGNLTTDGLGKYVYVTDTVIGNHTGSEISAFSIQSSGVLSPVAGSPFAFPMFQVQGEPTGGFLIGTTGLSVGIGNTSADDDNLYIFTISSTGAITEPNSPFATANAPSSVVVQPSAGGNLVYSLGISDSDLSFNPIEAFNLSSSGTLTPVAGEPFTATASGDVGAMDQSGAFLFVNGGTYNASTNTTTFQLAALNVSSAGVPSQTTTNVVLPNGGFFAVTDPQ